MNNKNISDKDALRILAGGNNGDIPFYENFAVIDFDDLSEEETLQALDCSVILGIDILNRQIMVASRPACGTKTLSQGKITTVNITEEVI